MTSGRAVRRTTARQNRTSRATDPGQVVAHSMGVTRQEFTQYGIEALRLFLRQPVPGFLDEIRAGEGGACQSHGLQRARALRGCLKTVRFGRVAWSWS